RQPFLVKTFTNVASVYPRPDGGYARRPTAVRPCQMSGSPRCASHGRRPRWSATMPPERFRYATWVQPASRRSRARPTWSGHARIESARYSYDSGSELTTRAIAGNARTRYSVYRTRNGGHVGEENSHTTIRPPGRVTRSISASASRVPATFRS